jgi:hypothetical protein
MTWRKRRSITPNTPPRGEFVFGGGGRAENRRRPLPTEAALERVETSSGGRPLASDAVRQAAEETGLSKTRYTTPPCKNSPE